MANPKSPANPPPPPIQWEVVLERWRVAADRRLRVFEARTQFRIKMLEALVSFTNSAVKALFLLNGGAIIALMAFYGSVLGSGDAEPNLSIRSGLGALILFIIGLMCAFLCAGLAFASQLVFSEAAKRKSWARWAAGLRILGIVVAMLGAALFGWGAYRAVSSLELQASAPAESDSQSPAIVAPVPAQ